MASAFQFIRPELLDYDTSAVDPQRVILGNPQQQLSNVFTNSKQNFFSGVWRSEPGKWRVAYTEDEFCYLTKGQVILTEDSGEPQHIKAGDAFVIAAGFSGTWETVQSCEKFYAIYEPAE